MSGLENIVDTTGSVASGFAMGQAKQRTELARLQQEAAKEEAALERETRQKRIDEDQTRYNTGRADDLAEKQSLGALLAANQPSLGLHVPEGGPGGTAAMMPIYGNPEAESMLGGFGGDPAQAEPGREVAGGSGGTGGAGFSWANLDPTTQRQLLGDVGNEMRRTATAKRQRDAYRKQRDQLFANISRTPGGAELVERLKDPVQRDEALASSSFGSNASRWLPIIEGGDAADNEMSDAAINSAMERAAKQQEAAASLANYEQAVASMNGASAGVPEPMTQAQQYARNAVMQGAKSTDPVVRAAVGIRTIAEQNSARRETQLNQNRMRTQDLAETKLAQLAGKVTEGERLQIDLIKEEMDAAKSNFDPEAFDAALRKYEAIIDAVNKRAGTSRVEAPAPIGRTPKAGAPATPAAASGWGINPLNWFSQKSESPTVAPTAPGGAQAPAAAAPSPEVQSAASFMTEFRRKNGRPPTREEMDAAFGGRGQ